MSRIIPVSILIIILFSVFFLQLGRLPVRLWDESHFAYNAYEMSENGNLIVPYFDGKPDTSNVKPTFPIWLMASCIKIIGPSETAIRIPSAFFGMLTSLLLFLFCWRYYNKFWLGFISASVLSTVLGYIDEHGARSGDTDIIHVFFLVLYVLFFWLYFERQKIRYLYFAMAGLALAVLTKGIMGLFALPVVFVAAFHFKVVKLTLKNYRFYLSLSIFLILTLGYYLLRQAKEPGYLGRVINYDLTGWFLNAQDGHSQDGWFYFDELRNWRMPYWIAFVPCGIACGLFTIDTPMRKLMTYITSILLFLFLILTIAQTKLFWYSYMLVPFCAILAAYFIWIIFQFLSELEIKKFIRYNVLGFVFLFVLFMTPLRTIIAKTYMAEERPWNKELYAECYYLREVLNHKREIKSPLKVVFSINYLRTHVSYYVMLLQKKNIPVTIIDVNQIQNGDDIVCSMSDDIKYVQEHFVTENVRTEKNNTFMHISEARK